MIRENIIHGLNNLLFNISVSEFMSKEESKCIHKEYLEFRRNHLTEENHIILANKIIEAIENKTHINLSNDFIGKNIKTIPEEAKL